MAAYIADLRDAEALELVGGKGANLGRLVRLGFPVPPGFVVTTAAYRAALAASDLAEADPETLRARLSEISLPAEVSAPLLDRYRRLGAGAVAVRSSGTAEDLAAASFAGQHDTFLDVTGPDALLTAVRDCWASLWSLRAVDYREQHGWDDRNLALAVVVQAMVPAEWAGVLFTADPVSGRRDRVVIEAVPGLGEALVSGEATGHRAVVAKSPVRLIFGDVALPRPLPTDLARLGLRVEAAFGSPQDVEWAYAAGRIALLQARPLTALPAAPDEATPPTTRYSRLQRAGAPNALDHLPLPPYPFDIALYFRPLLTRALAALRSLGLVPPPVEAVLIEIAEGVVQMVPPTVRPTVRALTLPAKFVAALRADTDNWLAECRTTLVARAEAIDAEDLVGVPDDALLARIEELQRLQLELLVRRFGYLLPGMLAGQALAPVLRLAVGRQAAGRLHTDLLAAVPCATTEINRALGRIARQIRGAAQVRAIFVATHPEEIAARLPTTVGGEGVLASIDDFLRRYGYRELAMAGAAFPAWRDDPGVVYGLLKGLVTGDRAPTALDDDPERADRARQAVEGALARRWRGLGTRLLRPALLKTIEATRRSIAFREDSHFLLFLPFTVQRRLALELGRRLAARGVLAEAQDIFFLAPDELRRLDPAAQVREQVQRRQAARRAVEGHYTAVPAGLVAEAATDGALLGVPASPGQAIGQVRIVRREQDFWKLQPGEVLVAPYTNPAWTPLFAVAGAVVVDAGGAASHAAIVAREYGIPAVMGSGNATSWLRDGQRVLVDGTAGRVVPLGSGTKVGKAD